MAIIQLWQLNYKQRCIEVIRQALYKACHAVNDTTIGLALMLATGEVSMLKPCYSSRANTTHFYSIC